MSGNLTAGCRKQIMHYDAIIIGAGLSGLSAGIRLAHFGQKVRIFEAHTLPGGLNSYYKRGSEIVDVGLHAMTNFAPENERSAPLNKLLRQLRIKRNELQLCPQSYSLIDFPNAKLRFSNDFSLLQADIARHFPQEASNFNRLVQEIRLFDSMSLTVEKRSSRQELEKYISTPLLREMLLCPMMFYGNAMQHDMDFAQFCIMFQSQLLEGMCRPQQGMKHIIDILLKRYQEAGGELSLGNGISSILCEQGKVLAVQDTHGEKHTADIFISSAGLLETDTLCQQSISTTPGIPGEMGFIEAIFKTDCLPHTLGIDQCITFRSTKNTFFFEKPAGAFNASSHVLCAPGNFADCQNIPAAKSIRVTMPASADWWFAQAPSNYSAAKQDVLRCAEQIICNAWPQFEGHLIPFDLFTPCTIHRFTQHYNGAIYGSPSKIRNGRTTVNNLLLCGTDQGFLGIVGSMMSGVIMANQHFVQPS